MADNYIEKAMEDMRSGKLLGSNAYQASKKRRYSGHIYIKDIEAYGIERVREKIREGKKVSFSFPEGHEGSRLARTLGCYYRPIGLGKPEEAEEI